MKKVVFFILLVSHIKICAIIILVHGTFATESEWCRPGGNFYVSLEQAAAKINEKIQVFDWAGTLNNIDRIQAAQKLAELILSIDNNEKIILIGHSFGGAVINLASNLLYFTEKSPSFYSFVDVAEFVKAYRELEKIRSNRCCKSIIEIVYLLGTPIDIQQFPPNMYVIKYLVNFHSPNDRIQSVLGLYSKKIENFDRIANFELIIRDPQIETGYPNHIQLHHPLLAQFILDIPFNFKTQNIGGFGFFDWNQDGIIEFAQEKTPTYTLQKKYDKKEQDDCDITSWS